MLETHHLPLLIHDPEYQNQRKATSFASAPQKAVTKLLGVENELVEEINLKRGDLKAVNFHLSSNDPTSIQTPFSSADQYSDQGGG